MFGTLEQRQPIVSDLTARRASDRRMPGAWLRRCVLPVAAWLLACHLASAQQADYRAQRLIEEAVGEVRAGRLEGALSRLREATSLACCARLKGMAYSWQGRALLDNRDKDNGLQSYRQALLQFDQAYQDATAAQDEDKQGQVLCWRVRALRRMLEARLSSQETNRCHALATEYRDLSRKILMSAGDKLQLEEDSSVVERLWTGLTRRYADALSAARQLYEAGEYAQCVAALEPWSSAGTPPADATELDAAEGFNLRALCLCQLAARDADQTRAEGLLEQARALFIYNDACSEAQKEEGRRALATAAERLGSRQYTAVLDKAWQAYERGAFTDCRAMLAQWAQPGQAPRGASPSQAAEGFNLFACCLCRLATAQTEQAQFATMMAEAESLFRSGAGCSDRGRAEGQAARQDALDNRYGDRLRQARAQYEAGALDEALTTLNLWTQPTASPAGASRAQNVQAFHLRMLCLCRKAALGGDDATCERAINEAKALSGYEQTQTIKERAEGRTALRMALITLGKARFDGRSYASAYLNLTEANDLEQSPELRFLMAECHRLDPESNQPYTGPAFLRDSLFAYRHVIAEAPGSAEAQQCLQRFPEVVRRCNQTALMQLEPGPWGEQVEVIGQQVARCLRDHSGTWWRPDSEATPPAGAGFLFDAAIEATSLDEACAAARERGDMWLLRVTASEVAKNTAGVIVGADLTVEIHDVLEGRLVKSVSLHCQATRVGRRDVPGAIADQLLRQLRDRFVTNVIEAAPMLLGDQPQAQ